MNVLCTDNSGMAFANPPFHKDFLRLKVFRQELPSPRGFRTVYPCPRNLWSMSPNLGIYEVRTKNLTKMERTTRNESVWLEDNFQKREWKVAQEANFTYQIMNVSSLLKVSLTPLNPNKRFAFKKWFSAPIYQAEYLILKA